MDIPDSMWSSDNNRSLNAFRALMSLTEEALEICYVIKELPIPTEEALYENFGFDSEFGTPLRGPLSQTFLSHESA